MLIVYIIEIVVMDLNENSMKFYYMYGFKITFLPTSFI
jgi:hypothetical protein